MGKKYEIKTMPKDVEELGVPEGQNTSNSANDSKKENASLSQTKKSEPPKGLPVTSKESSEPEKEAKKEVKTEPMESFKEDIASEETKQELGEQKISKTKSVSRKIIIPIIIVAIVLLSGGGIYYWYNYLREPKVDLPYNFIEVDNTKILEIQAGEENVLLSELRKELFEAQPISTLKQVTVKEMSGEKSETMSFCNLLGNLTVAIPFECLDIFDEDNEYMFLFYSQEEGIRSGFIAKVSDTNYLDSSIENWESTMRNDLGPIFLGHETGALTNKEFQTGTYKGVDIRYLNFVDSSFAIDYAIINDYFIVATSKDSMFEIIDRVLGE